MIGRVRALPGVRAVGAVSGLPLAGENWGKSVTFYDRPLPSNVRDLPPFSIGSSPATTSARSASACCGAGPSPTQDTLHSPPVAIVKPGARPAVLERRGPHRKDALRQSAPELVPAGTLPPAYPGPQKFTVVGVAGDVRYGGLDRTPPSRVYVPYAQGAEGTTTSSSSSRAQADPLGLAARFGADRGGGPGPAGREASRRWSPRPATRSRSPVWKHAARRVRGGRGADGGGRDLRRHLVLRLAASGEIGIRIALGAEPARVVAEVFAQGLRLTTAGIGIGLVAALAASRTLSSLLFGVGPADLPTYASVALILAGAALAASYLPARRAANVDPLTTLRAE